MAFYLGMIQNKSEGEYSGKTGLDAVRMESLIITGNLGAAFRLTSFNGIKFHDYDGNIVITWIFSSC